MYTRTGAYEGESVRMNAPLKVNIEKIADAYWNHKGERYTLSREEFLYCTHRIFVVKGYDCRYGGGVIVTEIIVEDNLVKPERQWVYDDFESFKKYHL